MKLLSLVAVALCVSHAEGTKAWRARQLAAFLAGQKDNGVPRYNDTYIRYDVCVVLAFGDDGRCVHDGATYLYMQQIFKEQPARVRLYKVVSEQGALKIKVHRFYDQSLVFDPATGHGLCDKKKKEHRVDLDNVSESSCDLPMKYVGGGRYTGSNVKEGGCETVFGYYPGYVTSEVNVTRSVTTSLDVGYMIKDGKEVRMFGTPQVFRERTFKPSVAFQQYKLVSFLSGQKDNGVAPDATDYVKYDACRVAVLEADGSVSRAAAYVYLQEIFNNGFPARVRLYRVVPDGRDVTLQISRYVDESAVFNAATGEGVCHRPLSQRRIPISNVSPDTCPIIMEWNARNSFIGSNTQLGGCISSFGPVKTDVVITNEYVQTQSRGFREVDGELVQIFGFAPLVLTPRDY